MDKKEIDIKLLYPNLIIYLNSNECESLFKKLQKSFKEFMYDPLFKEEGKRYKHEMGIQVCWCRIMQGNVSPVCLVEREGSQPCDAENAAVESLLNMLCEVCYVIRANLHYFTRKRVPDYALNVDPTQSHIYKVVYLKNNSRGIPFPHNVTGAVDYVEDYDLLEKYIEEHTKHIDTCADLFILNVLKSDRVRIRKVCQARGLVVSNLVGCSDMGMFATRQVSTAMTLQKLLKDGGRNVKYQLIGPRHMYPGTGDITDNKFSVKGEVARIKHLGEEQKEIVINPWIAEHLVLMEAITERNVLETPREIIWRSVRDCPDLEEFIIEKTRTSTGMILAECMIDKNVVGRARGYNENQVKTAAAENALQNLSKCCYYIEAKKSYFGSNQDYPDFLLGPKPILRSNRRIPETRIYSTADCSRGSPSKILNQFRSAKQEDLYFLDDFTKEEKDEISNTAKKMGFSFRWVRGCLCVYKKKKPKHVLTELLSTKVQENEKYRLIPPMSKSSQLVEGETSRQVTVNANKESLQQSHYPSSSFQAHSSSYRPSSADHTSSSQSRVEEQEKDEVPSWVMSFIKSAPSVGSKPPFKKKSKGLHGQGPNSMIQDKMVTGTGDVFSKFDFCALLPKPRPNFQRPNLRPQQNVNFQRSIIRPSQNNIYGSRPRMAQDVNYCGRNQTPTQDVNFQQSSKQEIQNFNFQGGEQKPTSNAQRDHVKPEKDADCGLTLSERLQRRLEEQKRSSSKDLPYGQNQQALVNTNKRPIPQGLDFREDGGPKEKYNKPTLNSASSQYRSSGMQGSKDEGLKTRVRNEFDNTSYTNVDRKPESTQHFWNQNVKQHFDQRPHASAGGQNNFSKLFDYNGPQDAQGSSSVRRPKSVWVKKLKDFKPRGHSFSKMEKYGKFKGPRGQY